MGQILSHELTNVLVVVVRYFGGTKLGTSGLIHAYKTATMDAFANAEIIVRTVNDVYRIDFDYGVMNEVMRVLKEETPEILLQDFNLRCAIEFSSRQTHVPVILSRLEKIESVQVEFLRTC